MDELQEVLTHTVDLFPAKTIDSMLKFHSKELEAVDPVVTASLLDELRAARQQFGRKKHLKAQCVASLILWRLYYRGAPESHPVNI